MQTPAAVGASVPIAAARRIDRIELSLASVKDCSSPWLRSISSGQALPSPVHIPRAGPGETSNPKLARIAGTLVG